IRRLLLGPAGATRSLLREGHDLRIPARHAPRHRGLGRRHVPCRRPNGRWRRSGKRDVGGDIKGETTNGGVTLDVSGDHWDGAGLDVTTRNGGVKIRLPEHYSAELEVGTTHGRLNVTIPMTVQGTISRTLTTTLGAGGAKLRAITTNGGVSIQ